MYTHLNHFGRRETLAAICYHSAKGCTVLFICALHRTAEEPNCRNREPQSTWQHHGEFLSRTSQQSCGSWARQSQGTAEEPKQLVHAASSPSQGNRGHGSKSIMIITHCQLQALVRSTSATPTPACSWEAGRHKPAGMKPGARWRGPTLSIASLWSKRKHTWNL